MGSDLRCELCGSETESFRLGDKVYPDRLCGDCRDEIAERERTAKAAADAERARLEREMTWLRICPPLYRDTDAARLPQDPLKQVLDWQYGAKGLLLLGKTGTGKTRSAWLKLGQLNSEGRTIRAFDCLGFAHKCSEMFRNGRGETWTADIARADVLFLDDFDKAPMTERFEAELFGIVERRTAHQRPIIVTTNATGDSLAARASAERGAALVRRLRDFCMPVVFSNEIKNQGVAI